jgi:ATP-binding cassette subfamily C protein CydC
VPFLVRFDPRIAVIDVAALASGGVLLPLFLKRFSRAPGRERAAFSSDLRASVVEHAQGMAELIALGAVLDREKEMGLKSLQLELCERRLASLQGAGDAGLIAASSLAAWTAALILAPKVAAGSLPGAEMAMLTVFILATFEADMPLPPVIQRAGELAASASRLFELIDAAPAVKEPTSPAPAFGPAESLGLVIRDLRFQYASDSPWVIDGLSIEIPSGGRVGISGPSGVGKSTLVNLLLRFWDYSQGSITLVGAGRQVELRSLRGEDSRRLFSVVPQSPFFFHASIRENLSVAMPEGREGDEEAIRDSLESAQLARLIASLPEGLETTVGERGHELSAGEARRLAVARALLKEAPIYILDEPTEGLDEKTADSLMAALNARLRGKTLLVISHRDRDLSFADKVVRFRTHSTAGL